jgi:hypothetical protein
MNMGSIIKSVGLGICALGFIMALVALKNGLSSFLNRLDLVLLGLLVAGFGELILGIWSIAFSSDRSAVAAEEANRIAAGRAKLAGDRSAQDSTPRPPQS